MTRKLLIIVAVVAAITAIGFGAAAISGAVGGNDSPSVSSESPAAAPSGNTEQSGKAGSEAEDQDEPGDVDRGGDDGEGAGDDGGAGEVDDR